MTSIDPLQSLAFSMQSNPGVYALLLGSGVSRSAEIPTGWEIVLDLLGKLAAANGQPRGINLDQWYLQTYGKAPEYSELLDALAKTSSERQQLLRPYFEPNEEEREEGSKQPTAAHRAIAKLIADGYVKVIVTTNFDRLIEQALEDEGISSTVVSTPDQALGALPIVHAKCFVLKLHGDYMDTRISNSPTELKEYPEVFNNLLDRILDEYGLIICGWSASWDDALRNAMERATSRRFTTHWAHFGDMTDQATQLANHRQAQVIPISGADTFFQTLQRTVESLANYAKPHLQSTSDSVAALKKYLLRPEDRIRSNDLISEKVERLVADSQSIHESEPPDLDPTSVQNALHAYGDASVTLLSMAAVAASWGEEPDMRPWERALRRLTPPPLDSAGNARMQLKGAPATLLLFALALGALHGDNLKRVRTVFETTVSEDSQHQIQRQALGALTCPASVIGVLSSFISVQVPGGDVFVTKWIRQVIRECVSELIPSDEEFTHLFDTLDAFVGLGYLHRYRQYHTGSLWAPLGDVTYRWADWEITIRRIRASVSTYRDASSHVTSGIFGYTHSECLQAVESLSSFSYGAARARSVYWLATMPSTRP